MPSRWLFAGKRPYNWTTHVFSARLFLLLFGKVRNRARQKALHLPLFSRKQRYPTLYGYSPTVLPKPANWDERITVTGYWFLDQATRKRAIMLGEKVQAALLFQQMHVTAAARRSSHR